jgi:hypothetical protein
VTRRLAPALLSAALALAACNGGSPSATPTINLPSVSGLPSLPGTHFTQGTAHVELSGGIDATFDVPLTALGATFNPDGGSSLPFADTSGYSFGLAGVFETGPTSNELVVTITTTQPQIALLTSLQGECTLTFDDLAESGITGSFTCEDLSTGGSGERVDATGEFEASP